MAGSLFGNQPTCTGCKQDHAIVKPSKAFCVRNMPNGQATAYFCEAALAKIPKRHRLTTRTQHDVRRRQITVAVYEKDVPSPYCYVLRQNFARRLPRVEQSLLLPRR